MCATQSGFWGPKSSRQEQYALLTTEPARFSGPSVKLFKGVTTLLQEQKITEQPDKGMGRQASKWKTTGVPEPSPMLRFTEVDTHIAKIKGA